MDINVRADNKNSVQFQILKRKHLLKMFEYESDDDSVNIDEAVYYKHPRYINYKMRLESFHHWPTKSKKSPEKLSKAGFFYTGVGQQVTCFSCGHLWITSKKYKHRHFCDYWTEHALLDYRHSCPYLISVKGTSFIREAWTDDRRTWFLNYEARKKREKRKAEREEKKKKAAEQAEKEMVNTQDEPYQNENEMEEIPTDQDT